MKYEWESLKDVFIKCNKCTNEDLINDYEIYMYTDNKNYMFKNINTDEIITIKPIK